MSHSNYYLYKDGKSGEILYLEYDQIKGYPLTPKVRIEDAINVNKIVIMKPDFSEKIIKKKIDIKLKYFIKALEEFEEDGGNNESGIKYTIIEAEALKQNLLNKYVKYLGHTYCSFTMKKIQVIINQLQRQLFDFQFKHQPVSTYNDLYYLDEDLEEERGRSR